MLTNSTLQLPTSHTMAKSTYGSLKIPSYKNSEVFNLRQLSIVSFYET